MIPRGAAARAAPSLPSPSPRTCEGRLHVMFSLIPLLLFGLMAAVYYRNPGYVEW